jgi:hypothetical protein
VYCVRILSPKFASVYSNRRACKIIVLLTGIGFVLSGCGGFFRFQQREAWRTKAEEECLARRDVTLSEDIKRMPAIQGNGVCGLEYPLQVQQFRNASITLPRKATLACPMVSKADRWLTETVQPAAEFYFQQPVRAMKSGSYACRTRNNQSGAKLSEHSFGNALDVMAFTLADGREITIARGWKGTPEEQGFLREVFVGACQRFNTVLGPGSDMFHYDHFHLDLARHDPRGERSVCRPVIKYDPQIYRAKLVRTPPEYPAAVQPTAPSSAPQAHNHQAPQNELLETEANDAEENSVEDPFALEPAPTPQVSHRHEPQTGHHPSSAPLSLLPPATVRK